MKKFIIVMFIILSIASTTFLGIQYYKYQDLKKNLQIKEKEIIELKNSTKEINNTKEQKNSTYDNLKKENEIKLKEYEEWNKKVKEIKELLS